MKRNAFTLIELLAVIVILAIIALIATPIILGIIKDAKEQVNERSAEMYLKAINNSIVSLAIDNKKINDGTYNILSNGNICLEYSGDKCVNELKVEIGGEIPINGTITIETGLVVDYELEYENRNNSIKKEEPIEGPEHLAQTNVRAVTESKTGIVPVIDENGNIMPGSEFKIKVSNNIKDENGNVVEYTFFVLSNSEDGKYVNLIAEQNITIDGTFTSEPQANDEWYVTSNENRYGPQTVYNYLSTATSNWTNIPIIESFNYLDEGNQKNLTYGYKSIITSLDSSKREYITTITPFSSDYGNPVTYKNMRARLPYESEVTRNTTCKVYSSTSDYGSCSLWMVNYLSSSSYYSINDGKRNSIGTNNAYWLLSSNPGSSSSTRYVSSNGYVYSNNTNNANYGVRPVITVLKSDLLRVMK